ncbi:MAG: SAM hydrolase/SAM-dependent halogenase family protein, partial [Planctomycetota bacterium]
ARGASATFHGRDVFGPAAARLAAGRSFARLGARVAPGAVRRLEIPRPRRTARGISAEVIHVDTFGNLVTNLRPEDLPPGDLKVEVGRRRIRGPARTYGDVPRGRLVALVGSHGFLEVAAREADAARLLRARRGTRVSVRRAAGRG